MLKQNFKKHFSAEIKTKLKIRIQFAVFSSEDIVQSSGFAVWYAPRLCILGVLGALTDIIALQWVLEEEKVAQWSWQMHVQW